MLAGLSSILGHGTVGHFIDPDGVTQTWEVGDGIAGLDGVAFASATTTSSLTVTEPAVAVLTGERTASSGEAVTIAFRGRADTRSFGSPTNGLSTATSGFELSDGALMIFAITTMADRERELFGAQVQPDEAVAGEVTGDPATDAALGAAVSWLETAGPCAQAPAFAHRAR